MLFRASQPVRCRSASWGGMMTRFLGCVFDKSLGDEGERIQVYLSTRCQKNLDAHPSNKQLWILEKNMHDLEAPEPGKFCRQECPHALLGQLGGEVHSPLEHVNLLRRQQFLIEQAGSQHLAGKETIPNLSSQSLIYFLPDFIRFCNFLNRLFCFFLRMSRKFTELRQFNNMEYPVIPTKRSQFSTRKSEMPATFYFNPQNSPKCFEMLEQFYKVER